jgi:aldehyde dehydrogenase (NAD+)
VKPSELTPHTSRLLRAVVSASFPEDEAVVIEGDASVGQELIGLPFDHIFFTGSTAVGRLVLAAAARNLSSVTLELGGKSPVVIDETADLENAARKIAWGTLINAGQTCVAPDYVIMPATRIEAFVGHLRRSIEAFYGGEIRSNSDYCRIVNRRHFDRIRRLVEEAVAQGAHIEIGGDFDPADHYVSPTVVTGVDPASGLLQEEIFGPILPIVACDREEDAAEFIRRRGRPLALYLFSHRKDWIERMLGAVPSGDAVVNDVVAHFVHPNLPFGGVGESGIGKAHGFSGFVAFSHERSILRQPGWTMMRLLYPPYRPRVLRLLRLTIRFLSGR